MPKKNKLKPQPHSGARKFNDFALTPDFGRNSFFFILYRHVGVVMFYERESVCVFAFLRPAKATISPTRGVTTLSISIWALVMRVYDVVSRAGFPLYGSFHHRS